LQTERRTEVLASRNSPTIPDPTRPRRKNTLPRADLAPGDCLCNHCSGKCCRYFSLPIETPTGWDDYDAIRWYLAHGQTLVYLEKGTWFLVVMTRCKYLSKDDRCRIYYSRPKICQDYTTAECEYDEDWVFEKVFETPEQLWEYAEAVLPPRKRPRPISSALMVISS
jgi:Fe-S-cluster containining protein